MRRSLFLFGAVLFTLAGCGGSPVGEPCKLTSGALGFGFDDPCATKCLELTDVTCADGSAVRRAICAGKEGCDPGSCPDGQLCYSFEDPFDEEFYCIPDDICGRRPATAQERSAWEQESRERSDALRAKFKERMERRSGTPSSPAATLEPKPAPPASLVAPAPVTPEGSVLVEAWGADLALVVCLSGNALATGADCAKYLPAGTELMHASRRLRTTAAKTLDCPASSRSFPGMGAEQLAVAPGTGDRWGWVPNPPPAWKPAGPAPLDPVLAAVMRRQLKQTPDTLRLDLAVSADLDGDPHEEKVVRAFYPSDDSDKPGRSTLWLIDDASMTPLPATEMELESVANVRGVVPLDSGGALLVFTTEWRDGSGVHVFGPRDDGLGLIAEVACGSSPTQP